MLLSASVPPWRVHGGSGPSEESGPRAGAPDAAEVAAGETLKVVYLGISGVLHPSASLYKFIRGRSLWSDATPSTRARRFSRRPWQAGRRPESC